MSQRISAASLTMPCLPQQPCHTLLAPMSSDKKRGEGEQRDKSGVASPGAHRSSHLHHRAQGPTFLPLPLPPLTPSTAHGSQRRSLASAEHLHSEGPRKEIYLPWQRHQQLSFGCPVALPHSPSPAPAVVGTSPCPRMMCAPCAAPQRSNLSSRELSLPNAEVSEWLWSLSTEQSLSCQTGDSGPIWILDGRWEI